MGEPNQGARFNKDKVHAVFKSYLHELEEQRKKHELGTHDDLLFYCRINSVEELYRRLGLGNV